MDDRLSVARSLVSLIRGLHLEREVMETIARPSKAERRQQYLSNHPLRPTGSTGTLNSGVPVDQPASL